MSYGLVSLHPIVISISSISLSSPPPPKRGVQCEVPLSMLAFPHPALCVGFPAMVALPKHGCCARFPVIIARRPLHHQGCLSGLIPPSPGVAYIGMGCEASKTYGHVQAYFIFSIGNISPLLAAARPTCVKEYRDCPESLINAEHFVQVRLPNLFLCVMSA